jgi:hypothetical protein
MSYGPFEEKPKGSGISMSRVIAFMFAVTYCYSLVLLARGGHEPAGWPFACLGIVTVMVVPLQALFKTVQAWLASAPGKALLQKAIEKFAGSVVPGLGTTLTTTSTVATNPNPPATP